MAADVVEHADLAVAAAHRDHRQPGEIGDDVVAGVPQLADVRDQLPAAVEYQSAVERGDRRFGIVARGQRRGVVERLRGEVGGCRSWREYRAGCRPREAEEGRLAPAFVARALL